MPRESVPLDDVIRSMMNHVILLYITLFFIIINPYFIFTVLLKSPLSFLLLPISRGFISLIWRDFLLVFIFPELGLERYTSIWIFFSK